MVHSTSSKIFVFLAAKKLRALKNNSSVGNYRIFNAFLTSQFTKFTEEKDIFFKVYDLQEHTTGIMFEPNIFKRVLQRSEIMTMVEFQPQTRPNPS